MFRCRLGICVLLAGSVFSSGCGQPKSDYKATQDLKKAGTSDHDHDHSSHQGGHTHYGAGPHGGSIIELGGDDFHAELVLDHAAHALRIFLLTSDAKTPLPTKGQEVTLTMDKNQKLSLKAVPLDGEEAGMSSRFELVDEEFIHKLVESGFLHGDLAVPIGEKTFSSHLDIHFEHGDNKPDHKHENETKPQ